MSERTLYQAWVAGDEQDRINAQRERFKLSLAEMTRQALLELTERLEGVPAPFERQGEGRAAE